MSPTGGNALTSIDQDFYARQRVTVRCAHCTAHQTNVHPEQATAWFAEHRAEHHPELPPWKRTRARAHFTGWKYRREHQDEETLEWREGRRYVNTISRT